MKRLFISLTLLAAVPFLTSCAHRPSVVTLRVPMPAGTIVEVILAADNAWFCITERTHTLRCLNVSDQPAAALVDDERAIVPPGITMVIEPKGLAL